MTLLFENFKQVIFKRFPTLTYHKPCQKEPPMQTLFVLVTQFSSPQMVHWRERLRDKAKELVAMPKVTNETG